MRRFDTNIITKVIIALLIAVLTLYVSKQLTDKSLRNTMLPVKQMTETNPQTVLANELFKDIVTLDYEQRTYISQTSNQNFVEYINSNKLVFNKLDSLQLLSLDNDNQSARVKKMREIMQERNNLFFQYLNLRKQFEKNNELNYQIQELSDFVNYFSVRGDSSIYSRTTSIKHSTVEQEIVDTTPVKRNIVQRILGTNKKAPPTKEINHFVLEQSETTVDTLALKEEDSIISQFTNTIAAIEKSRKQQLQNINVKQRAFEIANNTLIQELLQILKQVEAETIIKNQENNLLAESIIDEGLNTTNQVLLVFIVLAVVLAFLIFSDIAKSNKYKKELIIAKEEAEVLSKSRQQFLSNMSHELRTPLQSIIGYTELMQKDEQHISSQNINAVNYSSQHLLDIVNQILDYNSIQATGIQLERKPFSIVKLVQEVYHTILIQTRQKGLIFTHNFDKLQDEMILGDSFRLKQVLINILNNAVKFTNKGCIDFVVQQTSGKHFSQYLFIINDTGSGIEAQHLPYIFNEFEQINNNQVHNGNGLGLNIVKRILDAMNGEIDVKSKWGEGSIFTVSIQYPKAKPEEIMTNLSPAPFIETSDADLIWLIDDDVLILKLYAQILSNYNWTFQTFNHPGDVLNKELPVSLSLIIMDIRMPDISGLELIKIVKEKIKHNHRNIPVIAVTAQVLPEEKEAILNQGFDGILHKPFLEKDIIHIIQQFTQDRNPITSLNPQEEKDDILQLFLQETKADLVSFKKAHTLEDIDSLGALAHKLAGRLGQMQFSEEARAFRRIEMKIKQNQNPQAESKEALEKLDSLLSDLPH